MIVLSKAEVNSVRSMRCKGDIINNEDSYVCITAGKKQPNWWI